MERINKIIEQIIPVDEKIRAQAQQRLDIQTKPQGSLGRLEELAKQVRDGDMIDIIPMAITGG